MRPTRSNFIKIYRIYSKARIRVTIKFRLEVFFVFFFFIYFSYILRLYIFIYTRQKYYLRINIPKKRNYKYYMSNIVTLG